MSRVQSLLMSVARQNAKNVAADPDARLYINAVRNADGGRYMEVAVQRAIDSFVTGCKADGIWSAIKASCILMGARTLSGALTPLVGTAPTNNNFVSGDYNRKTGLKGDGTTKFIDTNRANNADGQNDNHVALWLSAVHSTTSFAIYAGAGSNTSGAVNFATTPQVQVRFRTSALNEPLGIVGLNTGFFGARRSESANFVTRINSTTTTVNAASNAPSSDDMFMFCRNNGSDAGAFFSDGRIAFYSIGSSLTLTLLESRVSTLYTAIGAAIP